MNPFVCAAREPQTAIGGKGDRRELGARACPALSDHLLIVELIVQRASQRL